MIKAIITDLDNTLLRTDKTVTDYTRRVLRRCRERGIYVMAASARPQRTILEFGLGIEFDAVTTLNGARIILPHGTLENAIPRAEGERILEKLLAIPGAVVSAEMSGGIYSNVPIPEWRSNVCPDFPRLPEGTLYKLLAGSAPEEAARRALTGDTYMTLIEGGKLIQFMSREATKWNGVREMLAAFGVAPADTVYFGDDWDDIGPVKSCGLGVAMENAIDEVKAVADVLTGHCDGDGVARYIEENIL